MDANNQSLLVYQDGSLVFSSDKKWLHPLFELEEFLAANPLDPATLFLEDKIIGRGAAFLIVRLGIRKIHARLLSKRGKQVFEERKIEHTWDDLVEKIECMTEDILADVKLPDTAYEILKERARNAARRR